jgi:hypothetical protein
LLAVADLTFVKAIEIAVAVETANKDAIELRGKSNPESSVNKVQRHHRPTSSVKTGQIIIIITTLLIMYGMNFLLWSLF